MSLNNPAFESQDTTDAAVAAVAADTAATSGAAQAEAKTDTSTAEQSTTTAIAQASSSALATPVAGSRQELLTKSNVLQNELRNALPVSWEDFTAINASQGQFQIKGADTAVQIGTEIGLKLVSFQDQWVSAPKDQDAEGEGLVKYSDDGVVLNDDSGMLVKDHQAMIESKGEEPVLSHRLVLVGELTKCGDAGMDEVGNLVQVVLAESGRRNFNSHAKQTAYQIANGRMKAGDAENIKLTAALAGTGKKQYTLVKVGYAEGHEPNKALSAVDTSVVDA